MALLLTTITKRLVGTGLGGRGGGGASSGTLASPGAGGGWVAAAWVAWCRAALALAFTLAAAPFRRRRPLPGAGEVVGGGGVELGEAGAGGSSSTSSLAFILPSLVVNVREADPPASFVCRSNFSSSPSILCSESEQKKMAEPKRHVLSLSWSQLNSRPSFIRGDPVGSNMKAK